MGKNKTPQLPAPPTYQNDPVYQQGSQSLLDYGNQLSKGDLTGNLSWLLPTINNNNSALALSAAQGTLQPQFRDTLQQISNQAAANGQLESSTFSDALARAGSDLNSQYQSIVSQQAINDSNQSNQNRLSLFGTGLDTLQSATNFGLQNQGQQNQFNLNNYDNQVAAILAGQKQSNGGLAGGLTGAIGGGLAGFALGGPIGAGIGALGGGITGGFAPQASNTGGSLLGAGAGLLGSSLQAQQLNSLSSLLKSGASAPGAGAFASNSLGNYGLNSSPNYLNMFGNSLLN